MRAGCFFGSLDAFIERVKEVHGGTKHEKDYMLAVELAKSVLDFPTKNEESRVEPSPVLKCIRRFAEALKIWKKG